jgi:hypothetical protein
MKRKHWLSIIAMGLICIIHCNNCELQVKVKVPRNRPEGPVRGRGIAVLFLDHGARRGGWPAPRPGRFTSEKDPVPVVQEAGWAPGPVWTCAKNLAPTGMRVTGHVANLL